MLNEWFPEHSRYFNGRSYEEFLEDIAGGKRKGAKVAVMKGRNYDTGKTARRIAEEAVFMALREIVQNRIDAEKERNNIEQKIEKIMKEDPYRALEEIDRKIISKALSAF